MKVLHVVGTRPNFMKVAPIIHALEREAAGRGIDFEQILVHTGQHYDPAMSKLFFEELGMPEPDVNLDVRSGSHGAQTGRIMERFEAVLIERRPDVVLVVGDVNSTVACTLDAKKLGIPVVHVEAGLRSGDLSMPEEVNRRMTDSVADLLLTTDSVANANLRAEGVPDERIRFTGNVMIDTLVAHREAAMARPTLRELALVDGDGAVAPYAVVTLHRPGNVDDPAVLEGIAEAIAYLGRRMPVLFPLHPRTRAKLETFELMPLFGEAQGIRPLAPQGYLEFLNLTANAALVLTDSGGIQEETTILGVPCLTLRPNTERPITIEQGTNRLVGTAPKAIRRAIDDVLAAKRERPKAPELWDGHAAERVAQVVFERYGPLSAGRLHAG